MPHQSTTSPTSPNGNTTTFPPLSPSPHMAGLILARGGSKGILLKNLAPLGSRPLISWSLQTMQEFGKFDSIWVSTDHEGIAECAQACGAKVISDIHLEFVHQHIVCRFSTETRRMQMTRPLLSVLCRSSLDHTR